MRTLPFTTFPGGETQAAFSPDGNQIAFCWNGEKEDNPDIYLMLIGAGGPFRLTSNPASDTSPAWSPDGRYIAFVRNSAKTGGFYLVPALGGPERKLAEAFPERLFLPSLSYSPDGQFLAVADKSSPEEPFSIFLLLIETGEKRRLTSPAGWNRGDYNPVFSPDGKMLAFVRFSSGMANDIYLVPVAGGEPRRLISETYFAYMTSGLAWTPDGREIIFSSDREASFGLWRVPATGGIPVRLAGVGPNALEPSISPRGNRLAYRQSTWDSNLWRLELSSTKGGSRAPTKLVFSTREDNSVDYSPDGQRIVFVSNRSGRFEIWVCEADGSNPVPLTRFGDSSRDDPGSPRWSPDGRYVAFDLFAEGQRDIAVVSAEGGRVRRLTREASQECIPSWSTDGRWVYFTSDRSGSYQIWKVPAQGGEALPVTKGGGYDSLESPDGKFLYYTKGREVPGIWRVPVGGGQETLVLDHHRAGYWRAWDVVAEGIYFATAEVPSRPVIEFFSFATGRVTQIAQLEKPIFTTMAGLTVSPDQRWLVYVQIDQSGSDLMLVENFQ